MKPNCRVPRPHRAAQPHEGGGQALEPVADEQYLARRSLRDLPGTITNLTDRLANLTADMATATAHADDRVAIGNRAYSRDEVQGALGDGIFLAELPYRLVTHDVHGTVPMVP